MSHCGFPAIFFGDYGQYRPLRFYPATQANHYDGQGAGREYSPDRWEDEPKLVCTGPVPASLLLLSATGDPHPALLEALDPDEQLRVRPGALPQSAATVDDADVVVIDATESAAAGIDTLVTVRRQSGVP